MKKTIPLAVLAAAVAVLLFLLLRSLGGVDPVAGAFEAETAAEEGLELAGPLEAPLPPEASDPTAPDEVARGEGRREAAGAVAAGESGSFTLRIQEKESEKPLAGAEVWFVHRGWRQAGQNHRGLVEIFDYEPFLREHGTQLVADDRAEVVVPRGGGDLLVGARRGEWWGMRTFPAVIDELELLELERDFGVTVQVVDPTGQPRAGVPVVIGLVARNRLQRVGALVRSVGAEGIAHFPHVQHISSFQTAASAFVGLGFPCADPPEHILDRGSLTAEPIRLVMPETGSVLLRLEDPAGEPLRDGRSVWLEQDPGDGASGRTLARSTTHLRYQAAVEEDESGTLLYEHVGVGLDLRAFSAVRGFEPVVARGPGPGRPGERVELTLRYGEVLPTFTGQIVDAAGTPLADRVLRLLVRSPGFALGTATFSTRGKSDERGAFRLVLDRGPVLDDSAFVELQVLNGANVELSGSTGFRGEVTEGVHDLGVVPLAGAGVLLSGRVVDDRGEPIRGAMVTPKRRQRLNMPGDRWMWVDCSDLRARTDEEGRFEIRGEAEVGEYQLEAYLWGHLVEEVPVALGSVDLRIVLRKEGKLAGSLLVDEGVPVALIELRIRPLDTEEHGRTARIADDGTFLFLVLAPGRYEVRLGLRGDERPLVEPFVVEVPSGETARPPGLQQVDLRGVLRGITVTVVDGDGREIDARLEYRPIEEGSGGAGVPVSGGRATFILRGAAADLRVGGEGFRTQRFEDVSSDLHVVLRRGIPVRLQPTGTPALPGNDYRLAVRLQRRIPVEERVRGIRAHGLSLTIETRRAVFERGVADVLLPAPGNWTIHWTVERAKSSKTAGITRSASPEWIEVQDHDVRQDFILEVPDRAEIAEAVERLK